MPGVSAVIFGAKCLSREEIENKRVIDVGSFDFNGSIRPIIENWQPTEYLGVDIIEGTSVDLVCNADDLVEKFGKDSFDVVLSLEMLEHSPNWQKSITNLKSICKPNGIILITTRSHGYPYHGYPNDFWRYELKDMEAIFADCEILALESDNQAPGVFIKARKPENFVEKDLSDYQLHSMVVNHRVVAVSEKDFAGSYFKRLTLKQKIKGLAHGLFLDSGKLISNFLKL